MLSDKEEEIIKVFSLVLTSIGVFFTLLSLFLSNEKSKPTKLTGQKLQRSAKVKKCSIIGVFLIIIGSLCFLHFNNKEKEGVKGNKLSDTMGVSIHELQWGTNFSMLEDYGVNVVRDAIIWDVVETKPGIYDFTNNGKINYDDFLQKFESHNVRPFLMLLYANKLYGSKRALNNDKLKQAYVNWVGATANRYKNKNIIWEIYNEPNIEKFWTPQTDSALHYADVLKRTAPLIRKNDPSGMIVAPSLAGTTDSSLKWLEEIFKQGVLEYIDAVSVHPYRSTNPETVTKDYERIRNLISKYTNKDIAIVNSEWGYSTVPNWNNKGSNAIASGELKQAQYDMRLLLIDNSQKIPVSIIYDWKNDGENPSDVEHHFGLLRYDQKTSKPSGTAFNILSKTLGDYRFVNRVDIGNSNDYLLKYMNDDSKVAYSYWTTQPEHTFILKGNVDGEITTMLGQKSRVSGDNLTLSISESPSYLKVD
ncbi:cellulase family glycosylhydrolase [Priestia megaterium]|uniref:cellulase family glycosylhydrolase n=1 Tax=Priestia megaterium TaxID=1404 RepID=UPI0012B9B403|nr:cellulase family glycosylhydrolase [Priestia megaterium]